MVKRQVVGAFDTDREAIAAIENLKSQGFTADEISVISKDPDETNHVIDETDTYASEGAATGAATGGIIGGLGGILTGIGALTIPGVGPFLAAGPIVAGITGAAAGAGLGGLAGVLIGMGITDEEAALYEERFHQGKVLVLIDSDSYNPTVHSRRTTFKDMAVPDPAVKKTSTEHRHHHGDMAKDYVDPDDNPLIDPNPLVEPNETFDPLTDKRHKP
ncbi:low temperature-induced protein [Sporosarcina sp. PTS2304]|uniref:general stress protein n=1 Tax=Sporosarcina sp. PTS2304 TaxID=2283194 RepID=UPI000E0DEAD5|nr:general stress protein [Sporosarcina sp. PTS2304]AXH98333.1 low temperature-induced protein [Sporosarcina sp. PTS2304]